MADRVPRTLSLNDLRFLGALLPGGPRVTSLSPLHGGMVNEVVEVQLSEEPFRAVVKVSRAPGDPFAAEEAQLRFLNEAGLLPCPMPLVKGAAGQHAPFAFLVLERLPGVNLGQARLAPEEASELERQLARILLRLHADTGPGFGFWGSSGCVSWLEVFEPMVRRNREACEGRLEPSWLRQIDAALARMTEVFEVGEAPEPRLVHGDVWSANVIVNRREGRWAVKGLVDPGLAYADVEYELAYLECFGSTGAAFFEEYTRERPMRAGYDVRKRYYWLNTMLLHVRLFGDAAYVRQTRRILDELGRMGFCG